MNNPVDFWDDRFASSDYVYGKEPNDFLKANTHYITGEKILCLAEGEGRNAVYLAKLGYEVTLVDFSSAALSKAKALAQEQQVEITIVQSDLSQYQIAENSWDAIIMIFAHLPPAIRRQVHSQCVSGLSDNGVLIIEGYTPLQLNNNTGGPKDESLLYTQPMFINDFSALSFVIFHEVEREISEGVYHCGKSNTLQLVALNRDHN